MSKLPKEIRHDLALQLASMLYEQLPFWKRQKAAKWYTRNNTDTMAIWESCLRQAAIMIDEADFKLSRYLEGDQATTAINKVKE